MDCHYPHFVAGNFHVALYFSVGGPQPGHKPLQRSGRLAFEIQSEFEEFVERIIGFMAEPPQNTRPAAIASEQPGIECKRRLVLESSLTFVKPIERIPESAAAQRLSVQRLPQRPLALPGQREQVVIVQPEQRALQRNRQRQVVL